MYTPSWTTLIFQTIRLYLTNDPSLERDFIEKLNILWHWLIQNKDEYTAQDKDFYINKFLEMAYNNESLFINFLKNTETLIQLIIDTNWPIKSCFEIARFILNNISSNELESMRHFLMTLKMRVSDDIEYKPIMVELFARLACHEQLFKQKSTIGEFSQEDDSSLSQGLKIGYFIGNKLHEILTNDNSRSPYKINEMVDLLLTALNKQEYKHEILELINDLLNECNSNKYQHQNNAIGLVNDILNEIFNDGQIVELTEDRIMEQSFINRFRI
jgi:hypothetical protein